MKKEIFRSVNETFDSISCVLRNIRSCLMADNGDGTWANSRESIDWEIKDLIQTIERVEE